jgi:hypothetical protein
MMADFVGALETAGAAPIRAPPPSEWLEHEGLQKPGVAECAKKMAEVARSMLPPRPAA